MLLRLQSCLVSIKNGRQKLRQASWRQILLAVIFALVFLLLLAPEFACLAFMLDAAVIDVFLVFAGLQLAPHRQYLQFIVLNFCGELTTRLAPIRRGISAASLNLAPSLA